MKEEIQLNKYFYFYCYMAKKSKNTDASVHDVVSWNELQEILPLEYITSVAVVSDDSISVNDTVYVLSNIEPKEAVRKIQNYMIGQKKHG